MWKQEIFRQFPLYSTAAKRLYSTAATVAVVCGRFRADKKKHRVNFERERESTFSPLFAASCDKILIYASAKCDAHLELPCVGEVKTRSSRLWRRSFNMLKGVLAAKVKES